MRHSEPRSHPRHSHIACEDLWRSFIERGGLRQDARDAVLHEQALLGAPALGHIDDSAHKFNEMAGRAQNRMTYRRECP